MSKPDPMLCAFGKNVRTIRESKGLTQVALAEKANVHRTYLCDVERGTRNISIQIIVRLATALGTTAAELCRDIHEPPKM